MTLNRHLDPFNKQTFSIECRQGLTELQTRDSENHNELSLENRKRNRNQIHGQKIRKDRKTTEAEETDWTKAAHKVEE